MFQFAALSGAQSASRASQSILELDGGVKILVDVGWDEKFDTRQLAELEKHVSTLSLVLLTHGTISHLGAYAHCCKHIPLFSQIPVYATAPVIAFGRTTLQDLYTSAPAAATFIPISASPEDQTAVDDPTRSNILREAPTFEEINTYFSAITPLKYSQPHQPAASYFSAPLEGLTLTAYNAGHTLGGTIWHIQHGMESIVYAVDWHQARENVIAGAAWFDGIGGSEVSEALRKPTALVCSSVNGDKIALSGGKKARDEALLSHVRSCLARGGTVLIPTDSSARILELAWLLEKAWQEGTDDMLKTAKVYMATKSAHATLRHARSLLEWMDDGIVREFEGEEENANNTARNHRRSRSKQNNNSKPSRPFEFRHVKIVETQNRLEKVLKAEGPRVIVASDLSVEWGYSRAALQHVASKPENLVLLTEQVSSDNSKSMATASTLCLWHRERLNGVALDRSLTGEQIEQVHTGRELVFRDVRREPLEEAEIAKYQQYMATQQQIKDSLLTSDGRQLADAEEAMDEDDESSSESENEEESHQGRALNVTAALTHGNRNKVAVSDEDLGVSILVRKTDVFDYDVRNKKGRNAVFPYAHARKRGDEFGDFIKPEEFLREEEREAQEAMMEDKNNSVLGQKRKWSDDRNKQTRTNKKQKAEPAHDGAAGDSSDDSDSEVETENTNTEQHVPSKVVYEERRLDFQARLAFVDFAGLHDQRSLQMIIPLINPKKLILIGGSVAETTSLAKDCHDLFGMTTVGAESESKSEIYSPQVGSTVDASVDTNAWTVKLTRDLVKRLQWQNVRNMSIVTISGQLRVEVAPAAAQDPVASKKLKLGDQARNDLPESDAAAAEGDKTFGEPVLDAIPANTSATTRAVTQPIHVGDLRLADLRRLMRESGHSAVFRGEGTLLIDDMVAVRKLASGRIVVEGPPVNSIARNDSFTQVKRRIYDGLAVVAAG